MTCGLWIPTALVALLGAASLAQATPYLPTDDAQVLEQLPERLDPSLREVKRLRTALAAHPGDLDLAVMLAKRSVEAARSTGDPRFLGQAQAALGPWWKLPDPPGPALLLRATIRQSNHDFNGALADLDRLIGRQPSDGQALLTRATVLAVQGKYEAALADCTRLAPLTVPLVVAGCRAAPASLSGDAEGAYRALIDGLARMPNADSGLREWALTLAGEIAERRNDFVNAQRHYRDAYALDAHDPYLIAAYCDFLLDRGRPRETLPFLVNQTLNDNLLLRLVLAEAKLPDQHAAYVDHRRELADRFDAAHRRGDTLRTREEARFRLWIENDGATALTLARANWKVQREPADLRILAEAATAAGDRAAQSEAATWIADHRLQDVAFLAADRGRR